MKKMLLVLAMGANGLGVPAQASDRVHMLPIAAAMAANNAQHRLEGVQYFFGKQASPAVAQSLFSDQTSQKTNAFAKSDVTACNWAFLSAMLRLQKRAKEAGAHGVINIASNYGNHERSSDTEFECHAGAVMAGVALKGDFVKFKDK
jgi:uncharacterized protein YbjQ (UPF0145 family)